MNGTSTLPILTNAPNRLAEGINAQPAGSVQQPVHPVEAIERQFARQADANQKNLLARVYGSHLPMKLHMEQTLLSQFRRPGGLPSSHLGLSIVLNRDDDIDWSDVFNRADNNEAQYEPLSELENRFEGAPKRRIF